MVSLLGIHWICTKREEIYSTLYCVNWLIFPRQLKTLFVINLQIIFHLWKLLLLQLKWNNYYILEYSSMVNMHACINKRQKYRVFQLFKVYTSKSKIKINLDLKHMIFPWALGNKIKKSSLNNMCLIQLDTYYSLTYITVWTSLWFITFLLLFLTAENIVSNSLLYSPYI